MQFIGSNLCTYRWVNGKCDLQLVHHLVCKISVLLNNTYSMNVSTLKKAGAHELPQGLWAPANNQPPFLGTKGRDGLYNILGSELNMWK